MFSDNLRFSRPLSRLLFNADCLALPVRRDKRELRRFPARRAGQHPGPLSRSAEPGGADQGLPAQPAAGTLAGRGRARRAFFMAPSTLRRKLSPEGQSYQGAATRSAATGHRAAGRRRGEFRRTGAGAGFADGSAFHKAFKKWTGSTPAVPDAGRGGNRVGRVVRRLVRKRSAIDSECPRSVIRRMSRTVRGQAASTDCPNRSGRLKPFDIAPRRPWREDSGYPYKNKPRSPAMRDYATTAAGFDLQRTAAATLSGTPRRSTPASNAATGTPAGTDRVVLGGARMAVAPAIPSAS